MAESEEAQGEAEGEEAAEALVVVDGDAALRSRAEDLEDDLECQVVAIDSQDFTAEASEDILTATAFVIAWDLEIRSGLDLLEQVRADEALAGKPVLIACARPTPKIVQYAMAWGADGVCCRPYDSEEIKAKLAAAEAAREAA